MHFSVSKFEDLSNYLSEETQTTPILFSLMNKIEGHNLLQCCRWFMCRDFFHEAVWDMKYPDKAPTEVYGFQAFPVWEGRLLGISTNLTNEKIEQIIQVIRLFQKKYLPKLHATATGTIINAGSIIKNKEIPMFNDNELENSSVLKIAGWDKEPWLMSLLSALLRGAVAAATNDQPISINKIIEHEETLHLLKENPHILNFLKEHWKNIVQNPAPMHVSKLHNYSGIQTLAVAITNKLKNYHATSVSLDTLLDNKTLLFVYGVLKDNLYSFDGELVEKEAVASNFAVYREGAGLFKGIKQKGKYTVGQIWKIPVEVLAVLDEYEGCPALYNRTVTTVGNQNVCVYEYVSKPKSVVKKETRILNGKAA